ncbi:hypothetical protein B9G55_08320 [Saccharibacillus sp. O16]|nr:hypothetical protein B9G55_08320 [Saccharibacillus sp. O16]
MLNVLFIAAIVVFMILRQLRPRKFKKSSLFILPGIALIEACAAFPTNGAPAYQIAEFALLATAAFAGGLIQAWNTDVFYEQDRPYTQANTLALAAWAVLLGIRLCIRFSFAGFAPMDTYTSSMWMSWGSIAILFLTKNLVLQLRFPGVARR